MADMDASYDAQPKKGDRLRRLEQSAMSLFASRGYDGTSLRDIAADAGVPLSLIDRHFGSKTLFFQEIQMRIWRDLNREREALLAPVYADKTTRPDLKEVIRAFAHPVIALTMSHPDGRAAIRLIRENTAFMVHHSLRPGEDRAAINERWIGALLASRPALTRSQAVWSLSLIINAVYSDQLLDGWLDGHLPRKEDQASEQITELVVSFCAGGIEALLTATSTQ
ncbi:MAG: TetR family transcriptional regulator [Polynucleobacter sp.]|nr:TetR family transcriptional regulator [Polynucleobacter sp.]